MRYVWIVLFGARAHAIRITTDLHDTWCSYRHKCTVYIILSSTLHKEWQFKQKTQLFSSSWKFKKLAAENRYVGLRSALKGFERMNLISTDWLAKKGNWFARATLYISPKIKVFLKWRLCFLKTSKFCFGLQKLSTRDTTMFRRFVHIIQNTDFV
jgi:hypothetical protein